MDSILLDTSFCIRLLKSNDELHQNAKDFFSPLVGVITNEPIFLRFNHILNFTKTNIFIFLSLAMSFFVVRQTLLVFPIVYYSPLIK